jgi:hypothetical protein
MTKRTPKPETLDDDAPPRGAVRAATGPLDYMPPLKRARGVRMEHLNGFERFARSLWRPALGWIGVLLALVITVRIALGLQVPAIDAMAAPIATVIVAMISRTVEKLQGMAG